MSTLEAKISLASFIFKTAIAIWNPNAILQQSFEEIIDRAILLYESEESTIEKQIENLIDEETAPAKLAARNLPKGKEYYFQSEIKRLLSMIPITPELIARCTGDKALLANELIKSYQTLCNKYPVEDAGYIFHVLCSLLPKLINVLKENPEFIYNGLLQLYTKQDQLFSMQDKLSSELNEFKKEIENLKLTTKSDISDFPVFISDRPFDIVEGFIERTEITQTVNELVKNEKAVTLFGIGGIGKTEIAKAVINMIEKEKSEIHGIEKIAWVEYDNQNVFFSIAKAFMDTRYIDDINLAWNKAYSIIQNLRSRLLIVIDNVETIENDKNLFRLADMPCRILITSRVKKISSIRPLTVGRLSEEDCVKLFSNHFARGFDQLYIVKNIIRLADRHTVTVELLAKLASVEERPLGEFYQMLVNLGFRLSDEKVSSINTKLQQEENIIVQLAKLFSVHHLQSTEIELLIPISVIPSLPFSYVQAKSWFGQNDRSYLNKLVTTGWLRAFPKDNITHYIMHSVIAAAVRYQYQSDLYFRCKSFIKSVTTEMRYGDDEYDPEKKKLIQFSWSINDLLRNHLEDEMDGDFLFHCAHIYKDIGNYVKANELLRQSIKIYKLQKRFGNYKLGQAYNLLGLVYYDLCKYRYALTQYKVALEQIKNSVSFETDCIPIITNIGITHMSLEGTNRCGRAYAHLYTAQLKAAKQYGTNDSKTLDIKFLLANCIANNNISEAQQIFEEVIKKEKSIYPADHLGLGEKYRSYGNFLYDIGDYSSAITMLKDALNIFVHKMGEKHPTVGDIKNTLGLIYQHVDVKLAKEYFEDYLNISIDVYGESNPVTAAARNNYGLYLFGIGNFEGARAEFQRAEKTLRNLGEYLPEDMGGFLSNQGQCFAVQGKKNKAREYYNNALTEYKRDPTTCADGIAKVYSYMGEICYEDGEKDAAVDYYETALKDIRSIWGGEHITMASIYNNYAMLLENEKKYTQAIENLESAEKLLLSTYDLPTDELKKVKDDIQRIRQKMDQD